MIPTTFGLLLLAFQASAPTVIDQVHRIQSSLHASGGKSLQMTEVQSSKASLIDALIQPLAPTLAEAPDATSSELIIPPTRHIALTFDDGPYGTATEAVLSILESEHVPATFFLVGKNAAEYPDLVKRMLADSFVIGNHSHGHSKLLSKMTPDEFKADLHSAETEIYRSSDLQPKIFRAPYGLISKNMKSVLKEEGYDIAYWNIDANDWNRKVSSTTIANFIQRNARDNSIVLLHDGRDTHVGYPRDNLIEALRPMIQELRRHGYSFVTVDKILNDRPYFDIVRLGKEKARGTSAH